MPSAAAQLVISNSDCKPIGNATHTLKASLFHLFQHSCQSFQVAWVGIDIKHLSVAVDEAVGGEGLHVEEVLHRVLLVCG